MPISQQEQGSLRRIHVSRKALKDAALSGAIDQYIFNVIAGSGMMNPQAPNVLPNANSAQGQGVMTNKLYKGRIDLQGSYMTWLTAEAFGLTAAASLPSGSVAAAGSGYAHTAYYDQTAGADTLKARTVEEHHAGSDVTTRMAYDIGQSICVGWRINATRGSDFATLTGDWVGRSNAAGSDLSAKDVVGNWPADPGLAPPKIGLWIEKNASGYDTKWDTTVSTPATLGTPFHNLTSPLNLGEYYETLEMSWASNIDLDKLYKGGTSDSAGIMRDVDGAVIVAEPFADCNFTLDLTEHAILQEIVDYFKDFDNDDPDTYSIMMCAVSDKLAATGCYYCVVVVLPCVYPMEVSLPTDNGPMTVTARMRAMQDVDGNPIIYTVSFDAYASNFYATS